MTPREELLEAVTTALQVHDGLATMAREGGWPEGVITNEAEGFIGALEAQEPPFTVIAVDSDVLAAAYCRANHPAHIAAGRGTCDTAKNLMRATVAVVKQVPE